jgi:hypothetical protein
MATQPNYNKRDNLHLRLMVLLFVILSVLFFIPVNNVYTANLGAKLLNSGHIIFFFCFTLAFFKFFKGELVDRIAHIVIVVLILSVIIESIQSNVGRAFELGDIYRNILGTLMGIAVLMLVNRPDGLARSYCIVFFGIVATAIFIDRLALVKALVHIL